MDGDATKKEQVEIPIDLQNALSAEPSALEAWRKLSPQDRQAHVADLESGSEPVARERCVRQLVNQLSVQVSGQRRR
jgi:uncharacterized protein YdeI (YjbR/CyaY-like superfamily)